MSRIIINLIRLCLLCMLPCLTWAQSLTQYEYWFDDDFNGRVSGSLSGTDAIFKSSISTDQLDNGIHKFCFRAKQSDGKYSAITSSLFLKRPSAQNSVVEYWFDDNFEQRESMNISSTEEEQELSFDLRDNTKYPMGFHKLNMRLNIEGEGVSAVYSAEVLKLSAGKATQLEYWVDDDRANRKTISGSVASDGYIFSTELDLSDITPGYHLLHCRAVSGSKRTVSAVTTTPVMVKLREYGDETVVKYSVAIDDDTPTVYNVKDPRSIVTIPHTLDARGLREGKEHRIDMKFYNSLGASVSTTSNFMVNAAEDPVITLSAREDKGHIYLQFNSIPNDVKYKVYRKKFMENNVWVCIPTYHDQNYPNTNYYVDMPLAGTYDYEVEGVWKDFYGKEHSVKSNKERLTTEGTSKANQFGCIEGIIRIKGKQLSQLPPDMVMDVYFSDGEKVRVQDNGAFYRANVPLGTTLTMTLADYTTGVAFLTSKYSFDLQSATVTEEKPIAHVIFEGIENTSSDMVDDYGYSELSISSLRCTDTSFSLDVTNTSGRTWTGAVYLKAIRKADLDKYDIESGFKWGSAFSFNSYDSYFNLGSASISQLANGKSQAVVIEFNNIPISARNEDYYIFIVSSETGRSRLQLLSTDVADIKNPTLWTLPASVWSEDSRPFVKSEVNAYLAEIFDCMKIFKDIDGPFKIVLDQIAYQLDTYDIQTNGETGSFGNLPELLRNFGDDLVNAIKDVRNVTDAIKGFKGYCDKVEQLYKLSNADSHTVWLEAMKATIKAYESWGGPLAGIYLLYLEATDKAINYIDKMGKRLYDNWIGEHFYSGFTKFNIKVKKKNPILENDYFKAENIAKKIRSVTITCKAPNSMVRTYNTPIKPTGRQLTLEPGQWIDHNDYDHNPPEEFYMIINWENYRVTKIPLGKDIVEIHSGQSNSEITVTLQSDSNNWHDMDNRIWIITQLEDLN